jgi:hypothetical protein
MPPNPARRPRLLPTRVEAASLRATLAVSGTRWVRGRDLQPWWSTSPPNPSSVSTAAITTANRPSSPTWSPTSLRSPVAQRGDHHLLRPKRNGEVTRLLVEPNPDDENPADHETDFNVMARRVEQIAAILDRGNRRQRRDGATTRLDLRGPKIY